MPTMEKPIIKRSTVALVLIVLGIAGMVLPIFNVAAVPKLVETLSSLLWPLVCLIMIASIGWDVIRARHRAGESWVKKRDALNCAFAIVTALISGGVLHGWTMLLVEAALQLYRWVDSPGTSRAIALIVCVPLTMLVGTLLFLFRLRLRSAYGASEVVMGLAVAIVLLDQLTQGISALSPQFVATYTTASLYLIVRGLDNVHQALLAPNGDPLIDRLRARARRARTPPASAEGL